MDDPREQPDIGKMAEQVSPEELKITFSKNNTEYIRKMVGAYGKTDIQVVLTAVSLLYAISKKTRDCERLIIIDKSGEEFQINMPRV